LTPTDWSLTYDGESVSLSPSIGNWSFECRSHYWIRRSQVVWARAWSAKEIKTAREKDRELKERYYRGDIQQLPVPEDRTATSLWSRIVKRFGVTTRK
jgi:hypothetical protein